VMQHGLRHRSDNVLSVRTTTIHYHTIGIKKY
jgi:hypothetical protein